MQSCNFNYIVLFFFAPLKSFLPCCILSSWDLIHANTRYSPSGHTGLFLKNKPFEWVKSTGEVGNPGALVAALRGARPSRARSAPNAQRLGLGHAYRASNVNLSAQPTSNKATNNQVSNVVNAWIRSASALRNTWAHPPIIKFFMTLNLYYQKRFRYRRESG